MKKSLLLLLVSYLSISNAIARQMPYRYSIDAGKTTHGIKTLRLGLQHDISEWLQDKDISVSGYFESSLNYWQGTKKDVYTIAFSPVIVTNLCNTCKYKPYIDLGIGVSLTSETHLDDRNLSSAFQFEDRIGFGIIINDIDYHVRYMHYSNADLALPNDGVDIFVAGVSFRF